MINTILFDLDGVLLDAKEIHFQALNEALPDQYKITRAEHISTYDGLKTTEKLGLLVKNKRLPVEWMDEISSAKQAYTQERLNSIEAITQHVSMMMQLKNSGFKIGVCTNSVRRTAYIALHQLGLLPYVDLIVSNEDVLNSKPHPEMYWKAMAELSTTPEYTLIVEDSPSGLLAAERSNAHVLRVKDPYSFDVDTVTEAIQKPQSKIIMPQWKDREMNVLIPMAGAGSRFAAAGYTFPKPLIDVNGKPMIQAVVENLGLDANYIFVVQKEHREKYSLDTMLNMIAPGCTIVETDGMTEGAACTALLAKDYINNGHPLFFANSDQIVEWDSTKFMYEMQERDCDGGIVTFDAVHPKWSYAELDSTGRVTRVAEKEVISRNATVGYYYWSRGDSFVEAAEEMISKDIRVNGEFYVCPVFNEAIADGLYIRTYQADRMWGIGTPEDLNEYLRHHPNNGTK